MSEDKHCINVGRLLGEPWNVRQITEAESAAAKESARQRATGQYVVCLTNRGNELSVIKGKLYRVVEPDPLDSADWIRIIDEEGEDYPYSREWFGEVEMSPCE